MEAMIYLSLYDILRHFRTAVQSAFEYPSTPQMQIYKFWRFMAFYYFRSESTLRRRIFIYSHLNRPGSPCSTWLVREGLDTVFLQNKAFILA